MGIMLRNVLLTAAFVAGAAVAGSVTLQGPATAQPVGGSVESCPDRMPEGASSLVCLCTPQNSGGGTIWGSDVYTADSPICRAATHAGIVGDRGGVVEVQSLPGRASYPSVTRNGIASGAWGSFPRSITFRGVETASNTLEDCPSQMPGDADALSCHCPSSATESGSVWGADVYTGDSALCRAALHAGVIGGGGGPVEVRTLPGRSSYPSATRNGVTSSSWATYPRSITFR
jgi:hypothetical protein